MSHDQFQRKYKRAKKGNNTWCTTGAICVVFFGGFAVCLATTVIVYFKLNGMISSARETVEQMTNNIVVSSTLDSTDTITVADDELFHTCYLDSSSGSFTRTGSILNDDYCDCWSTGEDELSTAACSRVLVATKSFDCGIGGQSIYASRVNDGVCDCINGRDEKEGFCQPQTKRTTPIFKNLRGKVMSSMHGGGGGVMG